MAEPPKDKSEVVRPFFVEDFQLSLRRRGGNAMLAVIGSLKQKGGDHRSEIGLEKDCREPIDLAISERE